MGPCCRPTYVAQARRYIEQRGTADMRNIVIDTVVVTAKPWDDDIDENAPEHRLAARSWNAEQIKEVSAGTILDFIEKMPGMQVMGRRVLYRGHKPAFMVDGRLEETVGMLSEKQDGREVNSLDYDSGKAISAGALRALVAIGNIARNGGSASDLRQAAADYREKVQNDEWKRGMQYFDDFDNVPDCLYYPIEQVARIDLIDRNQTTYWGTNLKGGIIAITMKKGKALAEAYAAAPSPDVSVVTPLGYQTPAEFYSPTYDTEEKRRTNTPDYRTTLYWNPVVKLDDLGQATVEFYTTDAPADYDISIEGVSQSGKIISLSKSSVKTE